jgi:DNA-binding IclR family transcriptional regulator
MTDSRPSLPEAHLEDLARRIRNDFAEMPGMQLTFEQIRRLWHVPREDCALALHLLVAAGLLVQDADRRFRLGEPRSRRSLPTSVQQLRRSA